MGRKLTSFGAINFNPSPYPIGHILEDTPLKRKKRSITVINIIKILQIVAN